MHPIAIFFCRFALAYAGLLLYSLITGGQHKFWYGWKEEAVFLLLGVSGGSLYFIAENSSLMYTQASNTSFLVSSTPLLTAILTLAFGRFGRGRFADNVEKFHAGWLFAAGTVLALGGMGLMIFEGSRIQLSAKGDLLAIGAALVWAVYSIFMGRMILDYGTTTVTRKVFFYGLLTIIPFLCLCPDSFSLSILGRTRVWTNLLFLGLVASLGCYLVWNLVINKLGNVTATNYLYLNPIFTLIFAMILLGERMTPLAATGAAAIMLGVICADRR